MNNDPRKMFFSRWHTRAGIADLLNQTIEATESDVPPFAPDDARLTDEVCQAFVDNEQDYIDAIVEDAAFLADGLDR